MDNIDEWLGSALCKTGQLIHSNYLVLVPVQGDLGHGSGELQILDPTSKCSRVPTKNVCIGRKDISRAHTPSLELLRMFLGQIYQPFLHQSLVSDVMLEMFSKVERSKIKGRQAYLDASSVAQKRQPFVLIPLCKLSTTKDKPELVLTASEFAIDKGLCSSEGEVHIDLAAIFSIASKLAYRSSNRPKV